MRVRAPRTPRELFELFLLYDPAAAGTEPGGDGLDALLDKVDWSGVSPRQVLYAVMGRLPGSRAAAVATEGFSARAMTAELLRAPEFQTGIIPRLLAAFPEKRRLLFVHIPKCAGTDLRSKLARENPILLEQLGNPEWARGARLFGLVADFVAQTRFAPTVLVGGHIRLRWFLETGAYRYGDRLFTVVRDPEDLVISQVNYVLTRFATDPKLERGDTRGWAARLGLRAPLPELEGDAARALARRALLEPQVTSANRICAFLGNGTHESAIEAVSLCDIEITDTSRYDAWVRQEWGIVSDKRGNVSRKFIARSDLDPAEREHVRRISAEDRRFHDLVLERLTRRSALSILGPEL